jgi:hypothetical protein
MKIFFSTSIIRTNNFTPFFTTLSSHFSKFLSTKVNPSFSLPINLTPIIGFLHIKTKTEKSVDFSKSNGPLSIISTKNLYIKSTITCLSDNLDKERLNTFLTNLNHFGLKRLFIIQPNAENQMKGEMNNLLIDFTLEHFISFLCDLFINKSMEDIVQWSHETIFIFYYPWYDVVEALKTKKISIYGGDATKRHVLTPYQRTLSRICDFFQITLNFTSKTYNSNPSVLNKSPVKSSSSISSSTFHFNGKRSYSTVTTSSSISPNKEFSIRYSNSKAFKYINNLFNSNLLPEEKQLKIEEAFRNFWQQELKTI